MTELQSFAAVEAAPNKTGLRQHFQHIRDLSPYMRTRYIQSVTHGQCDGAGATANNRTDHQAGCCDRVWILHNVEVHVGLHKEFRCLPRLINSPQLFFFTFLLSRFVVK